MHYEHAYTHGQENVCVFAQRFNGAFHIFSNRFHKAHDNYTVITFLFREGMLSSLYMIDQSVCDMLIADSLIIKFANAK